MVHRKLRFAVPNRALALLTADWRFMSLAEADKPRFPVTKKRRGPDPFELWTEQAVQDVRSST